MLWFKTLLSRLFKRDFTAFKPDPEIVAAVNAEYEERKANGTLPANWTSDCSFHEIGILTAHPAAVHYCCDGALSSISCGNRRYACVGHYGVCCSRC